MRCLKVVLPFLLALGLLVLPLASCTAAGETAEADGRLRVVTSFYVLYDLTQKIGGEQVIVTNLVPPGTEPHDWEPGTADLQLLENADLLIFNGAGMEHWLDKVLDALSNKDLLLVETTEDMDLLQADHAHDGTEAEETHGESDPEADDPHVWLDPQNALHQLERIRTALTVTDPAHADEFNQAYEQYSAELAALDREFRQGLAGLPRRDIIVAHEAFGYLTHAYGLNQVGIEGLLSESEPDPARMAEIVEFAREHDVQVIFFETLASSKVAETIAREIGARTAVLNPLEGLTEEQLEAGEDYFTVMRQNLAALIDALS